MALKFCIPFGMQNLLKFLLMKSEVAYGGKVLHSIWDAKSFEVTLNPLD